MSEDRFFSKYCICTICNDVDRSKHYSWVLVKHKVAVSYNGLSYMGTGRNRVLFRSNLCIEDEIENGVLMPINKYIEGVM